MNKKAFSKRLAALRQRLDGGNTGPDTAWIIQPENRRYLSGFKAEDVQITESSGSLLINSAGRFLLTDSRYASEAQKEAIDFEVNTLKNGLLEGFPGLVKKIGARDLGFEADYLTWGIHRELAEKLQGLSPPVVLVPLDKVVEQMREVKDDQEIKAMEASAELASTILNHLIENLRPGMTEKEAAWRFEGLAREAGAEGLAFPSIVASGPNGALPHAVPTDRKLRPEEPVVLDVGVRLAGYCSDMTRTVFLGEPDPYFKKIYKIVRQAQLAALKDIRPGLDSTQADTIARQIIKDAGFGDRFGHGLGHGVGLATHEGPKLGPKKPVKLKKGMVVTVEPGIYIPGKGGVRLEEMLVIEDDGPGILTSSSHFYDF
ncbi:MAG: aminopeptidase P family protein [Desulfobacterales bacterium]|nr:aminopeptidase P family protein [Desulfobacterales bacterium]